MQRRYDVGERHSQKRSGSCDQLDDLGHTPGGQRQLRSPGKFAFEPVHRHFHGHLGAVVDFQAHGPKTLIYDNDGLVFARQRQIWRRGAPERTRRCRHGANRIAERSGNVRYGRAAVDKVHGLSVVGPANVTKVVAHDVNELTVARLDAPFAYGDVRGVVKYESVYYVKRIRHRHSGRSK